MKDCLSPVYKVLDIIASHFDKLLMKMNDWKDEIDDSEINNSIRTMTNQGTDLYLCNIPAPKNEI